jgi:putative endonuclease
MSYSVLRDHNFYIGYSTNLDSRFTDHDNGKVSSTSARRPLELTYCEYHRNKYDALRRERYFKTTSGRKALRLMLRESLKEVTNLEMRRLVRHFCILLQPLRDFGREEAQK